MSTESMVTQADDLSIGQVQWHSSEEDGGPDVGILLRISETEELWLGELLDAEGPGFGFVLYGPGDARRVFQHEEYDDLRELVEEHIAPAIARTAAQPEREAVLEEAAQIADAEHRHLTNCYQKPAKKDAETAFRISHAIRALKTTPAPVSRDEIVAALTGERLGSMVAGFEELLRVTKPNSNVARLYSDTIAILARLGEGE